MITSLRNPRVAVALKLKKRALREQHRAFLVEGPLTVLEALRSGRGLSVLFHDPDAAKHPAVELARRAGTAIVETSEEVIRALATTVTPQGLVGVSPFVDVSLAELPAELSLVVALYAVRDPGNAGTVLRSADAAGADAVIFSSSSVDVYNPKAVRSSAGSLFHLPVVRSVEAEDVTTELRRRGLAVHAMSAKGERDLYEVDLLRPTAFVLGNEAWGLPEEVAALVDDTIRIPIPQPAESLNLAAAAAVCLFEAARQRTRPGSELGAVIAGAAHDIRSPLTALMGFASTLMRRWRHTAEEDRTAMLEAIAFDADRMAAVIRDLVDAARLAEGRLELSPERVSLREVVVDVAGAATRNPDHPEVVWEGQEAEVLTDPVRLRGAVAAMVEGALWWGLEGPIRVRARTTAGRLELEVARTGTDLAPTEAEGLFEVRAAGTGGGSKLALYVARRVVEAQGGTLTAAVGPSLVLRLSVPVSE